MASTFSTNLRRVLRSGFISFWRNGVVSIASVFVAVVTLFIIGSLVLSHAFLSATLAEIEDKVDVNVYFKTDVLEQEILPLKNEIETLPEVKAVTYVTREQALIEFKERNKNNALILQALDELGDNPLGAVLNVKAEDPSQYGTIVQFLEDKNETIIDNINYSKKNTS